MPLTGTLITQSGDSHITVPLPARFVAGDALTATIGSATSNWNSTNTPSPPTGWTVLSDTGDQIAPGLYRSEGLLFYWTNENLAPWQDAKHFATARRSLRGNQYLRMIENRWVSSESSLAHRSA